MSLDSITIDWSECIIIFNSLIKNIEELRETVESDDIDDDDLYDAEEELNDYITLLTRLREKYSELTDKSDLPHELKKKLSEIV